MVALYDVFILCFISLWIGGFLANLMIQHYIGNKLSWDLRCVLASVWFTILFQGKVKDKEEI